MNYRDMGYSTLERWLQESENPWVADGSGCTAILAYNDDAAVGVIECLRDAGLRVPDDVSVVGFDGTDSVKYFSPSLATVRVPLEEMGRQGIETLSEWINGEALPLRTIALPVTFEPGDSIAPPVNAHTVNAAVKGSR